MYKIYLSVLASLSMMLLMGNALASTGEKIFYNINPFGKAEYHDDGKVSVFHARMLGFDYQDTFYKDSATTPLINVDHRLKWWFGASQSQEVFDLHKSPPIIPEEMKSIIRPEVAFLLKTNFPKVEQITFKGKETISIRGVSYDTYHFVSEPHLFEIWISSDKNQIPVMVKGRGGFSGYAMKLHTYENP